MGLRGQVQRLAVERAGSADRGSSGEFLAQVSVTGHTCIPGSPWVAGRPAGAALEHRGEPKSHQGSYGCQGSLVWVTRLLPIWCPPPRGHRSTAGEGRRCLP